MTKHTGEINLKPGNYLNENFENCSATLNFTAEYQDRFCFDSCQISNLHLILQEGSNFHISTNGAGKVTIQKLLSRRDNNSHIYIKVENLELQYFNISDFKGTRHISIQFYQISSISDISIISKEVSLNINESRLQHLKSYNNKIREVLVQKSKFEFIFFTTNSLVDKSVVDKFTFENSCSRELQFDKVDFPNSFTFHNSYVRQVVFQKCNVIKNYFFVNNKSSKELQVNNLYLYNNNYPNDFRIIFSNKKFKSIQITVDENKIGSIYLENIEVDYMQLTGQRNKHNIILRNLKITRLSFINFSTDTKLIVNYITSLKDNFDLLFMHSELNNMDFFNIDFEKYNATLTVQDTIFKGFNAVNIVWPKDIKLIQVLSKSALRNTYLQLKNAMLVQNNKIQALKFEALEMEAYRNELKESKGRYAEKFILAFSWTNAYGQNFLRALGLYIVFALVSATVISFASTGICIWSNDFSTTSNDYWTVLAASINPTHSFTDLCQNLDIKEAPGWLIITDVFLRIIAAFFYFQIISAFRKYAKG